MHAFAVFDNFISPTISASVAAPPIPDIHLSKVPVPEALSIAFFISFYAYMFEK